MTNHLYGHDEAIARTGPTTVTDPAITVPTGDLRTLFDIATGSLNFGSGFLDSDEVDALRRVAVLIGVDPMAGTPTEFAVRIAHAYTPEPDDRSGWGWCRWCRRDNDEHPAADEVRAP
jgi:hypothetical protein